VDTDTLPDKFAKIFDSKVMPIIDKVTVNEEVYNVHSLVNGKNKMFIDT
jgi:hypothetical protein